MDAKSVLRVVYRLVTELLQTAVVRPAVTIFTFVFVAMAITQSGPSQVMETALQEVAGLVALGPAPAGYLNVETCADVRETLVSPDEAPKMPPEPVTCSKMVTEAVPIADMADEWGKVVFWLYLGAMLLGNLVVIGSGASLWPRSREKADNPA